MKRHNLLLILSLIFAFFTFLSSEPSVPSYGGKIQLKNASSYNIYIIFQTVEYTEKMLCVEKGEEIRITHIFSGDYRKSLANPVNYYTDISLYDFDSGLLLKNLTVNGGTFELKTGSVNSKNALFEFTINDDTFGGN